MRVFIILHFSSMKNLNYKLVVHEGQSWSGMHVALAACFNWVSQWALLWEVRHVLEKRKIWFYWYG